MAGEEDNDAIFRAHSENAKAMRKDKPSVGGNDEPRPKKGKQPANPVKDSHITDFKDSNK